MTKWLEKLEAYEAEGFKEKIGKASNPRIIKWAHGVGKADYMVDDSKTPWCGIGLAGVLDECGLGHCIPKNPAAAISWLECGVECEPRVGAIAVFKRDGGNHVTVIKAIRGHIWDCLGCNQGNSISTVEYDGRKAKGTRWPLPLVSPGELAETSRIAKAAARQQRDAVKGGTAGSTAPTLPAVVPPVPPKAAVQQTVDNVFGDISWVKGIAVTMMDLIGFVGQSWPFIAAAIAIYFGARMMWDSHLIKSWRVEDAIGGYTS
jgi:uncharacterized protein (TIGR02594 family)